MATEDILIRYRADVSQLEGDINKVIQSQQELTQATQQNTQAQQKAVTSAEFAAKKRAQLLEQEQQKLIKLRDAQKLAFDPTIIEKYNAQIAASQKRIELLGGSYQQAANNVQNSNQEILGGINRIGAAFGVAFTAEALVQFAQQAVTAFLDAQEQADKLRFAITSIGGEGEEALARLTDQAQQLAEVTFFGDDDITAAQAALSAFGLTAQQIEEIIPKLADFAAVTGGTVTDAANTLGGALEGRAGEFRRFGIEVDAASTKAENLAKVSEGLAQQTGAAAAALQTAAGQAKDAKDQFGELTEAIGGGIVDGILAFVNVIKEAFGPLIDNIRELGKAFLNLIPDGLVNKFRELVGEGNALNILIKISLAPILALAKGWELLTSAFIKLTPIYGGIINVLRTGFEQIKNLAVDLGSSVGEIFTGITEFDPAKIKAGLGKLKSGFQNIGFDVAKSFNEGYEKGQALFKDSNKAVNDEIKKTTEVVLGSDELRKKKTKELIDLQNKYAKDQTNLGKQNLEAINKEIEARKKAGEASAKAGEEAKKQAEEVAKLLQSLDAEIAKVASDIEKRKIEIIPANSQQAQIDRVKALADLNEKAITDEIQGKIKLVQEDAKLTDKQKSDIIAKYEELKAKRLELAQFNEQNELNLISAAQVKRIENAFKKIDDLNLEQALVVQADEVEKANEAVAKSFEDLGNAISKSDLEAAKQVATARTQSLNEQLKAESELRKRQIENAYETAKSQVQAGDAAGAELLALKTDYDNKIKNEDKKTTDAIDENNANLNKSITENTQRATDARIAQTFEILSATQSVLNEINGLFKAASDKRIAEIEAERDAQLESIDAQLEKNKEFLEERKISDEEFAANEAALQEERIRIEKETQKKIREEKRKQAILDKANALFEIGLNTAVAIVAAQKEPFPLSAILTGIIATTSALQAAAVIAQPIPYRKGSKNTGPKDHMARVGEEGEEIVFMPSGSKVLPARQTKRYGEVIDAMFDNRLDDYIQRNYITPALMAQQNARDNQRSKSFAENIANSITYNQSGLTASDLEAQRKRGQYIRNVDELADAIAKRIPTRDIYRS